MAKMSIVFDGFDTLVERLDEITNDVKPAVNEALEETQALITKNVSQASARYTSKGGGKGYATGKMAKNVIKNKPIVWKSTTAIVDAGFKLNKAWESIFVMYGTPKIAKDQKLFNAIKGTKTKKDIEKLQSEIMKKYISLAEKR